jgi:hypothetical protein
LCRARAGAIEAYLKTAEQDSIPANISVGADCVRPSPEDNWEKGKLNPPLQPNPKSAASAFSSKRVAYAFFLDEKSCCKFL